MSVSAFPKCHLVTLIKQLSSPFWPFSSNDFVRESKKETQVRLVIFGSLIIPYLMFGLLFFPHLRNL